MSITLSVIIPTYKRTHSLKRLLQKLKRQTLHDKIEVLVIDQNKSGFLEDEIQINDFKDVRHIMQESPNASMARNIGAKNANGEYLLFLDDDLVPNENFCEQGMNAFASHEFVDCFVPYVNNGVNESQRQLHNDKRVIKKWNDQLMEITDAMSAALFIRKKTFYQSGGFDVLLFDFAKTAEDQEFFLRFSFKGITLFYIPAISIFHDENQNGGCDLRTVDYWITREKCIKSLVYRYKIHRGGDLKLNIFDIIGLSRSIFLNRKELLVGSKKIIYQIKLLRKAIDEANLFLYTHKNKYLNPRSINHLTWD